jgi:methionine biosynthesis protein MetW
MNKTMLPASIGPRADFALIAGWITPGARVLDLGCGDGSLLAHLRDARGADGYGVDISDADILACTQKGVNAIQMNLEEGLSIFGDDSFDFVILSQTLQTVMHVEGLLQEILRVGKQGIVTFPNFSYWHRRWQILMGHMPVSEDLPYQWFNTPNIHLCTVKDFDAFCDSRSIRVLERAVLTGGRPVEFLPNLLGSLAVYRLGRLV